MYTSKPLPLFQDAYVATKILRSALTPNLYIFTDEDKPTNAILLLERGKQNKQNKFLQACETLGLCGIVYSPQRLAGFTHINLNEEINENRIAPNYLFQFEMTKKRLFSDF